MGVVYEENYEINRKDTDGERAIQCYNDAIAVRPDYAEAMYNKDLFLSKLSRKEEAIESLDAATKADPSFADAFDSEGSELNFIGKYNEAIECFDQAIKIRPDFAAAIHNKANTLYHLDRVKRPQNYLTGQQR